MAEGSLGARLPRRRRRRRHRRQQTDSSAAILNPGDWVFADGDPSDIARNAGTDDLVLPIAGLTRVGEPFLTFLEAAPDATPAP